VKIDSETVAFDIMEETLCKTTIGQLKPGSRANIERSFQVGTEIGGHLVSGHVTGTAEIVKVENPENNQVVTLQVPHEIMAYIFPKGFVALDGASLTVVGVDKASNTFTVWLIPETLRRTTFGWKREGDLVNLEIDSRTQAIVDTVKELMKEQKLAGA
jgi:riboflavin synthase